MYLVSKHSFHGIADRTSNLFAINDVFVGTRQWNSKVVKINQEFKNVVVSHKALIEAEL